MIPQQVYLDTWHRCHMCQGVQKCHLSTFVKYKLMSMHVCVYVYVNITRSWLVTGISFLKKLGIHAILHGKLKKNCHTWTKVSKHYKLFLFGPSGFLLKYNAVSWNVQMFRSTCTGRFTKRFLLKCNDVPRSVHVCKTEAPNLI